MFETILVDLKRNKVKLARREIDRFKRNYPDDYRGQFLEGELLSLEGKTSAAIEQLLSVCQRCPTDYDAQRKLGLLYYKQGDRVKAKQFFENYLALKPTADDIEYIRGYLNEK